MITLVFYSEFDSFEQWSARLAPLLPDIRLCCAHEVQDDDSVHYALVWKPPRGFFAPYRNLKLLVNLGAGVDASMRWWGAMICRISLLSGYLILIWHG